MTPAPVYRTALLDAATWPDFAALVEAHGGVWGGCWCMGFHPDSFSRQHEPGGNRAANEELVRAGHVRQVLVYDGADCVGWAQFGTPAEIATIKNPRAYAQQLQALPQWRIGCLFTASRRRGQGVARAAVGRALEEIAALGGGVVEAYPEQTAERPPQRGAHLHTGPEELFGSFGFTRDRRIATWRWVMRLEVPAG